MKLSVVMSNYNGARYLDDAIDSVISQNYSAFEFLVIDDGSTDTSREIIDAASNRYGNIIRRHYFEKNQGQGACLNFGINHVDGEVVSFMDSDDLWLPGKLESVADAFQRNPGAVMYQHNLMIMQGTEITDRKFRDILVEGNYYLHTLKNRELPLFVPTTGLSIRRDCLQKVLPIPDVFRVCADGYLTRTSMCWGDITSNAGCYGIYRVHEKNSTYGNNGFDERRYLDEILFPALNKYYAECAMELRFGKSSGLPIILDKILDTSLRKILREYLGWSV